MKLTFDSRVVVIDTDLESVGMDEILNNLRWEEVVLSSDSIELISLHSNSDRISLTSSSAESFEYFTEEKKTYINCVASKIKLTKEAFLRNFYDINSAIEKMTKEIFQLVKLREKALKETLVEIGNAKLIEWDRQLNICEEASELTDCLDGDYFKMGHPKTLQTFMRKIGLIDAGELEFEAEESAIGSLLENLGKINYYEGNLKNHEDVFMQGIVPKLMIGGSEDKNIEFSRPWGVCSDPTGRILVSDRSNNRIIIFNEYGKLLLEFGKAGNEPGEFSKPAGIAVDESRIIVADKDNHRIQVFTYFGVFLFMFGKLGCRNGEFNYPWDVAVNKDSAIAVSDSKNNRIQLFDSQGCYLAKFSYAKLNTPRSLDFSPDGSLFVTDFNNHRIVIIEKNFKRMKILGSEGNEVGQFNRPQGIAFDESGRFAVADCKNYRIQVFDNKRKLRLIFGAKGNDPGRFDCPQGICFHPNGNIIVVDMGNDRVQVF